MNKTDNTKQVRHGNFLMKCLHIPKQAQQRLNYQRHQHQNNYYTNFVSDTVEQT
jgi:hypothetical protein